MTTSNVPAFSPITYLENKHQEFTALAQKIDTGEISVEKGEKRLDQITLCLQTKVAQVDWRSDEEPNLAALEDKVHSAAKRCFESRQHAVEAILKRKRNLSLTEHTLIHALDHQRLAEETEQNKKVTLSSQMMHGADAGLLGFAKSVILTPFTHKLAKIFFKNTQGAAIERRADDFYTDFLLRVPMTAMVEEMLFRGILQDGIYCVQTLAQSAMPEKIKNTRAFQWLTSPSARILSINSAFALIHLTNGGAVLTTAAAVSQVANIFLLPAESILYETTGSLIPSITCHMMRNLIGYGLVQATAP